MPTYYVVRIEKWKRDKRVKAFNSYQSAEAERKRLNAELGRPRAFPCKILYVVVPAQRNEMI